MIREAAKKVIFFNGNGMNAIAIKKNNKNVAQAGLVIFLHFPRMYDYEKKKSTQLQYKYFFRCVPSLEKYIP